MSSTKLFDLSGGVAAVTGGNGGIGRSIALGLAQAGAAVAGGLFLDFESKGTAEINHAANLNSLMT